jgi:hypothetical protein
MGLRPYAGFLFLSTCRTNDSERDGNATGALRQGCPYCTNAPVVLLGRLVARSQRRDVIVSEWRRHQRCIGPCRPPACPLPLSLVWRSPDVTLAPARRSAGARSKLAARRSQDGLVVTPVPKVPFWKLFDFNALQPTFGTVQRLGGSQRPGVQPSSRVAAWRCGRHGGLSHLKYSLCAMADGHAEPRLCKPPNGESSTGTAGAERVDARPVTGSAL